MAKLVEGYVDRMVVPSGKRDVQEFDDELPGFGIRKFASDKASYFVKSWATKALHEQPNWATPLRAAAIANALSDRMVEARAAIACLREVDPGLRLSNVDRVAPPLRRAEDRVRFIESLRKAGLPE